MILRAPVHLNRKKLLAWQLKKIQSMFEEIVPGNTFYTKRLRAAGVKTIGSLEEFSQLVPFTFKKDWVEDQQKHPPYGTNLTYGLHSFTRLHQTSATKGRPLYWLDTPESWTWALDNWNHVYQAAGLTSDDRILFPFSFGPFYGFWTAFESASRLGCLCLPSGGLRSSARLRMIVDHGCTVLCCTPTYVRRLAEVAREEKIDLEGSEVRLLIVAGETGASTPVSRTHIEQLWPGARLVDHYGMTEVGPVTYECPKQPCVLHIIETQFYPEVVDPKTGKSVPDGHVGELVLTNLGRTGSPVLRYRTGDLVRWEKPVPCSCGSHELVLRSGILGRLDDMIVVRGVNVFPSAVEEVVRSVGGVVEYQVKIFRQRAMTELSMGIETEASYGEDRELAKRVQIELQAALSLRIPVSVLPRGTLPRFELKAQRWIQG